MLTSSSQDVWQGEERETKGNDIEPVPIIPNFHKMTSEQLQCWSIGPLVGKDVHGAFGERERPTLSHSSTNARIFWINYWIYLPPMWFFWSVVTSLWKDVMWQTWTWTWNPCLNFLTTRDQELKKIKILAKCSWRWKIGIAIKFITMLITKWKAWQFKNEDEKVRVLHEDERDNTSYGCKRTASKWCLQVGEFELEWWHVARKVSNIIAISE